MDEQNRPCVEETLARLGLQELEERLEVSPLLAGDDVQDVGRPAGDGGWSCCTCKIDPKDPPEPEIPFPPPPGPGG